MSEAEEAFAVVRAIRAVMDQSLVNDRKRLDMIMEVLDGTDIGAICGRRKATPVPAVKSCDWCKGRGSLGPPEDQYMCPKCEVAVT